MIDEIDRWVIDALEDVKAQQITRLDVTSLSDVMDTMIIATGTSNRHIKSLATHIITTLKQHGLQAVGVEGLESSDWVLVDYGTVVVHVMLSETRQFYNLEELWSPVSHNDTLSDNG